MKSIALSIAAIVALSAQAPASAPMRTLVYEFGYNTKAASEGNGTGTTTIEILGPAKDGGMMVSGTDNWWNTARPRATNTCEVYANGGVSCSAAPYALSPIQLTIFPLLGHAFFKGIAAQGSSTVTRTYEVKAAIIPGNATYAGQLNTWACSYTLHGKGTMPKAAPAIEIHSTGTLTQEGGRYLKATSKQQIVWDPVARIPLIVSDVRSHIPQRSVYSNDLVDVKLLKDSKHS